MKLYRWLRRGYHDGRIVEPGEEVLCADSVIPGAHMVDVAAMNAAADAGEPVTPAAPQEPPPVFRADLAHTAGMPIAPPVVVERALPPAPETPPAPEHPAAPASESVAAPEPPAEG